MSKVLREAHQTCKTCGSKLVPLFYTVECDRCDKPATGWFYVGYVVWTIEPEELWMIQDHPIFRYPGDCEVWREKQYQPVHFEVRNCFSYDKFVWDLLPGTTLEVAGIMHRVKMTRKYDKNAFAVILLPRHIALPPHSGQIYVDKSLAAEFGLDK